MGLFEQRSISRGPALWQDLLWTRRELPQTFGISTGGHLRGDCASQGCSWDAPVTTSVPWMKVPAWRWVTHNLLGQRWHPLPEMCLQECLYSSTSAGVLGTRRLRCRLNPPRAAVPLPAKRGWLERLAALWFNGCLLLQCLGTL